MKEFIEKYKNILILGTIAILGIVAYTFLAGGNGLPAEGDLVPSDTESAEIERELLDELLKLQAIELNESLFADALFLSLVDFSKPLVEQPVGRSNPFAPITGPGSSTPPVQ